MISLDSTLFPAREAGVVYTKPWMVELVLDLAGYLPEKRLAEMVALEPSAGDGAFLSAMVRRLVESCERHGAPLAKATAALQAFEIDPEAAEKAVRIVQETLASLRVPPVTAEKLARGWIKVGDFLEASLCFPIADFVIGNPPYIRVEEIPEKKAAMYRNGFSAMRGRADIYVAFYQAALLQLKPRGVCAYICADRWMLNDYGSTLREFITTEGYNVRHIIEAHDVQAFESEVSAYPTVTIISREDQGPVIVSKALPGIETENRARLVKSVEGAVSNAALRSARFNDWFYGNEPWPCSSPEALKLLKHLEVACLPLECKTTGTKIGIGVATGADKVFISPNKPEIESDRILPLALPSDLKDGKVQWSGQCMANPWNAKGLVDLTEYPRLKQHLGNNFNNRTEEAIGTAHDLWTDYREGSFGDSARPFVGWLMLVEDAPGSRSPVSDRSQHFPVRPEFENASYVTRYDVLCRKLMQENLYTAASVITSPATAARNGRFTEVCELTGLKSFVTTFAAHIAAEAAR